MELLLLEPQLASFAGHYNRFVRVFAAEGARRGIRLSVACSTQIAPRFREVVEGLGVRVLPAFDPVPYRMAQEEDRRDQLSQKIAADALAALAACPEASPMWLSGTGALLGGACLFTCEARRPVLFQMLDFAEDWPMGEFTAPRPLRAAVAEAVGCGLRLEAQSPLIAFHLARELGAPVGVFPAILDLLPLKPRPRRARPVVGFTNMLRSSKDIGSALRALLAHGDRLSLLLHTGQNTTVEAVRAIEQQIAALTRHYRLKQPEARIVAGVLSAGDYAEMWQDIDCTIMPYDPGRYARQGSGMLFEALADAIIPIAPRGTSMAASMQELELGFTYDGLQPGGLSGALAAMLENFDAMSERLRAYAPLYREANSPERVVDAALRITSQ